MYQKREKGELEILEVEEYLKKRKQKKEQDKNPEPVSAYSSFRLLSAFLLTSL